MAQWNLEYSYLNWFLLAGVAPSLFSSWYLATGSSCGQTGQWNWNAPVCTTYVSPMLQLVSSWTLIGLSTDLLSHNRCSVVAISIPGILFLRRCSSLYAYSSGDDLAPSDVDMLKTYNRPFYPYVTSLST